MLRISGLLRLIILIVSTTMTGADNSALSIESILRARFESEQALHAPNVMTRNLAQFYQARQFKPVWIVGDGIAPAADNALDAFSKADNEGLDSKDYTYAKRAVERAKKDPTKLAEAEIALTMTAFQYIDDIGGDRLNPAKIGKELYMKKSPVNAPKVFTQNMEKDQTAAWLKTYTFQNPQYQSLKQLLAEYREKQRQHPEHAAALSKGIEQIIINMERWRWLPETMGSRYVMVNIPAYELKAIENNQVVLAMPVIIGHQIRKTPVFASQIESIRFNPSWHVPRSIAVKDKLPKIKANPSYISNSGFVLYNAAGQVINPRSVNWSSVSASNFNYHLRQVPGPRNALGKIRFTINSPYGVYLHDTSEPNLFNNTNRALSSGCIRVKDPLKLAMFVFNNPSQWSANKIKDNMKGTLTKNVPLTRKVPVYITYFTVSRDENGQMRFTKDIYGKDQQLKQAMRSRPHRLP